MYGTRSKKRRLEGVPAPDTQLAVAVVNEHTAAPTVGQEAIVNSINNLTNRIKNVTKTIRAMEHNDRQRTFNSHQIDPAGSIRTIQNVRPGGPNAIGATPLMQGAGGVFPNTRHEMLHMSHADIDTLAAFYQEDFGTSPPDSIDVRRGRFAAFVGTPLI